jgi:hypothetical protein
MRIHTLSVLLIVYFAAFDVAALPAQQGGAQPVTELVISPRAVEHPVLKHRLLPAEYELREGNAAPILLRLAWEQTAYFSKVVPRFEEHLRLPLHDPKLIEAGTLLKRGLYEEMRRAAHRRTAHWEYPIGEQQGMVISLPDVQGARQLAGRGLSVWIRYHIATGQLEQAAEAIRVGFAISRHYGQTPFVVTQLIRVALNNLLLQRVEELVSQPGAANYYWALSALPRPLVDLRPALELQSQNLEESVEGLDRLEEPRSVEEWDNLARIVFQLYFNMPGAKPLTDAEKNEVRQRALARARAELPGWMEGGAGRVAGMPDSEAAVRWLVEQHHRQTQEITATMSLEGPAALEALRALQDRIEGFRKEIGFPGLLCTEIPHGLYLSCHSVQRRIDALRCVEAIRNFTATNSGTLPDTLDQITETPVPNDLLTGKPFQYERSGGSATLSAPDIASITGRAPRVHYRLTIRAAETNGSKK